MRYNMNKVYLENEVSFGGVAGYCGPVRQVDKMRAVVIRIENRDVDCRVC